jgi:hypothetical protein
MLSSTVIGNSREVLEQARLSLRTGTFNSIRNVLPDEAILGTCRALGLVFRNRLITPVVTVLHGLLAGLWPEESFAASWAVVWDSMASRVPQAAGRSPHSGSVAKARARLPLELWTRLFDWLSEQAQKLAEPYASWRGHRVVLLDGTCVSMSDGPTLREAFGTSRKGKFPLMRIVTAALAHTMTVLSYTVGRYDQGENELSWPVLKGLRPNDLIVADRRFAGAVFYHRYVSMGLQFITRMHQRLKVSRLRRLEVFGKGDFLTEVTINPQYRRRDPSLPSSVTVRLIHATVRVRGKREVLWLATSLVDAAVYPAEEIVELYARRWRIETLFREVKVALKADVLRSLTVDGVKKEMAARMMALNIVRMIMLEAAEEHEVDPLRISFVEAVRAILHFAPEMARAPGWKLMEIYHGMLKEIASHLVPYRPGRNEPRAVRRDWKHYPTLKETREAWRRTHAA